MKLNTSFFDNYILIFLIPFPEKKGKKVQKAAYFLLKLLITNNLTTIFQTVNILRDKSIKKFRRNKKKFNTTFFRVCPVISIESQQAK